MDDLEKGIWVGVIGTLGICFIVSGIILLAPKSLKTEQGFKEVTTHQDCKIIRYIDNDNQKTYFMKCS
jgi:uncharacterized iron-regulated membrane protein